MKRGIQRRTHAARERIHCDRSERRNGKDNDNCGHRFAVAGRARGSQSSGFWSPLTLSSRRRNCAVEFAKQSPTRSGRSVCHLSTTSSTKMGDRKEIERKLKIALQSFDEAPIFTIHGFCARVLADRAFESGVPFDAELVTDQSRFLNEVADDFWRAHFYTDDTIMAALLRRERLKPAQLVELLAQLTNNPKLRVMPPPEDRAVLEKKIAELCEAGADSEGTD